MNKDAFSGYHPAVTMLYFVLVIGLTMFLGHPVCLGISLLFALIYSIYLKGKKAVRFNLMYMLPMLVITALINPAFSHQGVTVLAYLPSGNPLTLESMLYGLSAGGMLAAVLLWFTTYQAVMTSDKFVYLFGRAIPALSLVLSMTLRFVPKFRAQLRAVQQARQFAGNSEKTGPIQKVRTSVENFSILVTWSLENAVETADSMRARGYGLPGRTAFSIFRFETRDARLLAWLLACGGLVIFGWAAGTLAWRYYPTVRGGFTGLTALCAAAELALALTPWAIDAWEARKWNS